MIIRFTRQTSKKMRSPVKMYGQCGHTYQWSGDLDQLMLEGTICSLEDDSPSQSQIPVKPSMPQPTPVGLHIDHLVARFEGGRPGLELEAWTISVGSDYIEPVPEAVPAAVCMQCIHMGWQVQGTRE